MNEYQCSKCGVVFRTKEPVKQDGKIVCEVCNIPENNKEGD